MTYAFNHPQKKKKKTYLLVRLIRKSRGDCQSYFNKSQAQAADVPYDNAARKNGPLDFLLKYPLCTVYSNCRV